MRIKPKDIQVDLPIALTFQIPDEIPAFAAAINTIIHGKVKVKCEEVGKLDNQYIGIFYLFINDEYYHLRQSFIELIEGNEVNNLPDREV